MSAPACLFASEHPLRRRKMSSTQSRSERDTVTAALHIHMCCSMQPDYKQHSACSTLSSPRKFYGVNHHLGGITAICCHPHLRLPSLLLLMLYRQTIQNSHIAPHCKTSHCRTSMLQETLVHHTHHKTLPTAGLTCISIHSVLFCQLGLICAAVPSACIRQATQVKQGHWCSKPPC